jgi:hypothetical protein
MNWLINGTPFTGISVTVGTGKTYATISAALAANPAGDILVLYYNGSEGDVVYTSNTRAVYVKGMVAGASVGEIDVGQYSPINVFGFEGISLSYAVGSINLGNGFFSKCIANSGNAFWNTSNGDTSPIVIRNCTTVGTTIVDVGSMGYAAPNTQVVKTLCAPITNPGGQYPPIWGIIESADYVTTATSGYGASYENELILQEPTSIIVTPSNKIIALGLTQQYTATAVYSDNTTADITSLVSFSSSHTGVATISSTGLATSVATGQTTITATLGISGSTTLSVKLLSTVTVTPQSQHIVPLQSVQFFATAIYSDSSTSDITTAATWTSSNTGAVSISSGLARGVNPGVVTITASFFGKSGTTILTVDVPQPHIYLSWSDDGGHTWSSDYPASIGSSGQRKIRAQWRRLGYSRDRVFRIMCADKIKKRIIGAVVE